MVCRRVGLAAPALAEGANNQRLVKTIGENRVLQFDRANIAFSSLRPRDATLIGASTCRDASNVDASYYRWRKEYGGLKIDQAKRMKDLERENARLKRVVADFSLEKAMLQ